MLKINIYSEPKCLRIYLWYGAGVWEETSKPSLFEKEIFRDRGRLCPFLSISIYGDFMDSREYFNLYKKVNITVEEAQELIRQDIKDNCGEKQDMLVLENVGKEVVLAELNPGKPVMVHILDALGKFTAKDCISTINQPPFDRSPLDGYAFKAADSVGASKESPVTLSVIAEVDAGDYFEGEIEAGQAVRIMTGAPIPSGADCVIKQEDTDYGEESVQIYKELKAYDNFCYAGEDFKVGDCLIEAGTKITAIEVGILASMGISEVEVLEAWECDVKEIEAEGIEGNKIIAEKKKLETKEIENRKKEYDIKVAIFSTGDELVAPDTDILPKGKIYNSNMYLLVARMKELGINVSEFGHLGDDSSLVAKKIKELSDTYDLIITTGGVSVGKKDIMHEALDILDAKRIFWRVKLKPGMPTIYARVNHAAVLCLSGNPYGAAVNVDLLGRCALATLAGDDSLLMSEKTAILQNEFLKGGGGVPRYVRAFYDDGKVFIKTGKHSSGVLGSMQGCNCLIVVPADAHGIKAGDQVTVALL